MLRPVHNYVQQSRHLSTRAHGPGRCVQVDHKRLNEAISLSEAVKLEAERRCTELQRQLGSANKSVADLTELQRSADSVQRQLAQEKRARNEVAQERKRRTEQVTALMKERDALRDTEQQQLAIATTERNASLRLTESLSDASKSLAAERERAKTLVVDLAAQREQCGTLTQRMADAVAVSQQVRNLGRTQTADASAAKHAAEQARERAAAAQARAEVAEQELEAARSGGSERDQLLREFIGQIRSRIREKHCRVVACFRSDWPRSLIDVLSRNAALSDGVC